MIWNGVIQARYASEANPVSTQLQYKVRSWFFTGRQPLHTAICRESWDKWHQKGPRVRSWASATGGEICRKEPRPEMLGSRAGPKINQLPEDGGDSNVLPQQNCSLILPKSWMWACRWGRAQGYTRDHNDLEGHHPAQSPPPCSKCLSNTGQPPADK